MLQQQLNTFSHASGGQDINGTVPKQQRTSTSTSQPEPATLTQGSPVMINSYSSLYKQAQQQQMAHLGQQRLDKDPPQHRPLPSNSPFTVPPHGQAEQDPKMAQHQVAQQMLPEQQYPQQQQQMLANNNYSALNNKHKQYKQAQSQKSAHLGSQRSKSRQGAPPGFGVMLPGEPQKMVSPAEYAAQFTAGSLDGPQQDVYRH